MKNTINIEFLKIEFRKLYDEINNIFNCKGKDIVDSFKNIVEYITLLIYEKNKILYDDKVDLNENITRLYNKKLISGKIYRIISEPENTDDNNIFCEFKVERVKGGA